MLNIKEYRKEYHKANKNKIIERSKQWRKDNIEQNKLNTRNWCLKRKYGIDLHEYEKLLEAQNNVCKICLKSETRYFKGKISALAVDHDHVSGKIRGLLCHACNNAIGYLKDSSDLARRAADYLDNKFV